MPCDEILDSLGLLAIARSSSHFSGHMNVASGALGERAAEAALCNVLGMSTVGFRGATHGFDGVFKDAQGNLVVAEYKATLGNMKNPSQVLSSYKTPAGEKYKQMDKTYIVERAKLMQREGSSLYSQENAALGRAIINANNNGTLRCVLVETSGAEQAVAVYERTEGKGWELTESIS